MYGSVRSRAGAATAPSPSSSRPTSVSTWRSLPASGLAREGRLPQRRDDRLLSDSITEYLDGERDRMRSLRDYARHRRVWSERFLREDNARVLVPDRERGVTVARCDQPGASKNFR